jgi:hypothetical protein
MRILLIGLVAVAALGGGVSTASAQNARWCSQGHVGSIGFPRCDYYTLQQCRAAVSGVGGSCTENPDILWARRAKQERRARSHRRRHSDDD